MEGHRNEECCLRWRFTLDVTSAHPGVDEKQAAIIHTLTIFHDIAEQLLGMDPDTGKADPDLLAMKLQSLKDKTCLIVVARTLSRAGGSGLHITKLASMAD